MGVFTKRAETVAYNTLRPLTAAAQKIRLNEAAEIEQFRRRQTAASQWQSDAWDYYDAIGEVKYAFNLVGSILSRVRFYVGVAVKPDEPPTPASEVKDLTPNIDIIANMAMHRLDSTFGGQPGLLRDAAINLAVAGECYLVQFPEQIGSAVPETWEVLSVDELTSSTTGTLQYRKSRVSGASSGAGKRDLPPDAFVGRIWRPHARFGDEADASMRGVLDSCDELLLYGRTARATAKSRLNAGALFVPDGLSVAGTTPTEEITTEDGDVLAPIEDIEEVDQFEDELVDAMTTPIADEESASAVVPLLVRGPSELGEKIRYLTFERSFDANLQTRADRALERILQGIDVPKDIVTGLANVKYTNAIQIDESLYKAHIEPMALLLCDALTVVYLRPAIEAAGYTAQQAKRLVVWYDPSEILTRPDRAQDANDGYDRKALSGAAWRKAHGFPESDAPIPEEIAIRVAVERGQLSDTVTEALLRKLIPDLMEQVRQEQLAQNPTPISPGLADAIGGAPAPEEPAAAPEAPAAAPTGTP